MASGTLRAADSLSIFTLASATIPASFPRIFTRRSAREILDHLRFFMRWSAAAKKTWGAFLATHLTASSTRCINLPRRVSHGMRPVAGFRRSSSLCLPMVSATAMEGILVLMVSAGRSRVCSVGDGKSLLCAAAGLREIEVAGFLWLLR